MLAAYLFSLVVGGGLLGFSLFAGGKDKDSGGGKDAGDDHDHGDHASHDHGTGDHDLDHGADPASPGEALHDGMVGDDVGAHASVGDAALAVTSGQKALARRQDRALARMRPEKKPSMVKSLRFWTFLTAFGGLTGTSVTALGLAGEVTTGVLAAGLGLASAIGVGAAQRAVGKDNVTSLPTRADYIGAEGTVLLPVARGDAGKIRVIVQGSMVDLRAVTEEEKPFALHAPAFVLEVSADGTARIVHPEPAPRALSASEEA